MEKVYNYHSRFNFFFTVLAIILFSSCPEGNGLNRYRATLKSLLQFATSHIQDYAKRV